MDKSQVDISSAKAELFKGTRKAYHTPHLGEHGNLQDLTQGYGGTYVDAVGFDATYSQNQALVIIYRPPHKAQLPTPLP
jgi:hypothetical protein